MFDVVYCWVHQPHIWCPFLSNQIWFRTSFPVLSFVTIPGEFQAILSNLYFFHLRGGQAHWSVFLLTPILFRYFYLESTSTTCQAGASKLCTVHSKHYQTSLSCPLLQRSAHSCQLPAFFPVCRVVYNSMSLWGQSSWIRSFGSLVVVVGAVVVGVLSEKESSNSYIV